METVSLTPDLVGAVERELPNRMLPLTRYWKWGFQLHSPDVLEEFDGLSMGEKSLLSGGLVNMLRSEKFRWQG